MGSGGSKKQPVPPQMNTGQQPIPQKPVSRQPSIAAIDNQAPTTPKSISAKGSPAPSRASLRSHESARSKSSRKTNSRNENDLANENDHLQDTGVHDQNGLSSPSSVRTVTSNGRKSATSRGKAAAPHKTPSSSSSRSTTGTPLTDQRGRCPHCIHCQRHGYHYQSSSEPKPKWILDDPGLDQPCIHMDKYDEETLKENLVQEYGHYPGGYDYQPFLTIDEAPEVAITDDGNKYYKQPKVANNNPRATPTHTPFPGFKILEQRELRVNKPYSDRLYMD